MQLNPFHPPRLWSHLGHAYFIGRRYAKAIGAIKQIGAPDQMHHACLAASYAYLDDDTQAAAHKQDVVERAPDFSVAAQMENQHYLKEAEGAYLRDGLLKAGLPNQYQPAAICTHYNHVSGLPGRGKGEGDAIASWNLSDTPGERDP